jgi:hypothetical protein
MERLSLTRGAPIAALFAGLACGGTTTTDRGEVVGAGGSSASGGFAAGGVTGGVGGSLAGTAGTGGAQECGGSRNVCRCPGFEFDCNQGFKTWVCTRLESECGDVCPAVAKPDAPCQGQRACARMTGAGCEYTLCLCDAGFWRCGQGSCYGCQGVVSSAALPGDPCWEVGAVCDFPKMGGFKPMTCRCDPDPTSDGGVLACEFGR